MYFYNEGNNISINLNDCQTFLKREECYFLLVVNCISFNRPLSAVFSWYIFLSDCMCLYYINNCRCLLISPRDTGFQGQELYWWGDWHSRYSIIFGTGQAQGLYTASTTGAMWLWEPLNLSNSYGPCNKNDSNFLLRPPSQRTIPGQSHITCCHFRRPHCTRIARLTPVFSDPISLPDIWNSDTEAELFNLRN